MKKIRVFKLSGLVFIVLMIAPFGGTEWTKGPFPTAVQAAGPAQVSKTDNTPVRIAVYSGEGAYFRSIRASLKMFQWMGADARRIMPQDIIAGTLDDFDIV